jgi:hypothetical protein
MYQADFVCTYKLFDDIDENDQEQLYRIQLLQAFDLTEWNDDKINKIIEELYLSITLTGVFNDVFIKAKLNNHINEILEIYKLSNTEIETDKIAILDENDIVFKLLFKFEYFDLTHRCLIDYLINKSIDEKYLNKLLSVL